MLEACKINRLVKLVSFFFAKNKLFGSLHDLYVSFGSGHMHGSGSSFGVGFVTDFTRFKPLFSIGQHHILFLVPGRITVYT